VISFQHGLEAMKSRHPDVTCHSYELHAKCFDPQRSDGDKKVISSGSEVLHLDDVLMTKEQIKRAKALCVKYQPVTYPNIGRQAKVAGPFGYRDGQALVVFFYNTPSNSLPIFWSVFSSEDEDDGKKCCDEGVSGGQILVRRMLTREPSKGLKAWVPLFQRFDSYNVPPKGACGGYYFAYDAHMDREMTNASTHPMTKA